MKRPICREALLVGFGIWGGGYRPVETFDKRNWVPDQRPPKSWVGGDRVMFKGDTRGTLQLSWFVCGESLKGGEITLATATNKTTVSGLLSSSFKWTQSYKQALGHLVSSSFPIRWRQESLFFGRWVQPACFIQSVKAGDAAPLQMDRKLYDPLTSEVFASSNTLPSANMEVHRPLQKDDLPLGKGLFCTSM